MSQCIACNKASRQAYREANRDKERARNRDYGKRNAHVVRARVKRWRKENPGKARALRRMREAQKINACPPWARKGSVRKQMQAHYLHAEWLEKQLEYPFTWITSSQCKAILCAAYMCQLISSQCLLKTILPKMLTGGQNSYLAKPEGDLPMHGGVSCIIRQMSLI